MYSTFLIRTFILLFLPGYLSCTSFQQTAMAPATATGLACAGFPHLGTYSLDTRATIAEMLKKEKQVDFERLDPLQQRRLLESVDLAFELHYNSDCTWYGKYDHANEQRSGEGTYEVLKRETGRMLIRMDEQGKDSSLQVEQAWVSRHKKDGINLLLVGKGKQGTFLLDRVTQN